MGDRLGIQVAVDILHFSTFLVACGVKMKYFLYILHHILSQKLLNRKRIANPKSAQPGLEQSNSGEGSAGERSPTYSTAEPPIGYPTAAFFGSSLQDLFIVFVSTAISP